MSGNASVLCCCCRLVDPVASKWKAAGDGVPACLPTFGSIRTHEPERRSLDRRWGGNWLAREKCTSNKQPLSAAGCLLSVAPPSPSPTSFAKFAEDFLLHGFCNKLVIYLSSSVSNNSIRGLDFLVVDFLLLSFCSCCLFVFGYYKFVA